MKHTMLFFLIPTECHWSFIFRIAAETIDRIFQTFLRYILDKFLINLKIYTIKALDLIETRLIIR